jgi:hypothetical protein
MYINFLGHVCFFCPCLVLHLKRVNENRNCFTICYRHSLHSVSGTSPPCGHREDTTADRHNPPRMIVEDENDDQDDATSRTDIQIESSEPPCNANHHQQQISRASSESSLNTNMNQRGGGGGVALNCRKRKNMRRACRNFNMFNVLFNSKIRYLLLFAFVVYFAAMSLMVALKLTMNIPIVDLLPEKSYLRKHMVNHLELFDVGPIIMFSFLKPMHYWNVSTFNRIRSMLNDAKTIGGGLELSFEMNWLQDALLSSRKEGEFDRVCKRQPLNFTCFHKAFKNTVTGYDIYIDDVVYDDYYVNVSEHHAKDKLDHGHHVFQINASRIYAQFKNFYGTMSDLEVMYNLKWLAEKKHHFKHDEILIYSTVYPYLEQLDEIGQSFLSIAILTLDSILFVAFFLLFDLRSILLLGVVVASCTVSTVAGILYLGVSLNIVTLGHFIMLPAFLCEFFFSTGYLFIFKAPKLETGSKNSKTLNVYLKYSKKSVSKNAIGSAATEGGAAGTLAEAATVNEKSDDDKHGGQSSREADGDTGELHARSHHHVKSQTELDEVSSILLVQSADEASLSNFPNGNADETSADAVQRESASRSKKKLNRMRSLNLKRYGRSNLEQRRRLKKLKFVFYKATKQAAFFLVNIFLCSLSIMHYCDTYSFHTLYVFLVSAMVNLFLHLFLFYPTLLCFFGTNWRYVHEDRA